MAFKNISFSVALVATAIILFTATTTAIDKAINPCEKATDKALCVALTGGAKTWPDAMTNSLRALLKKGHEMKNIIYGVPKRLPPSLGSIGDTCKDCYENFLDTCEDIMKEVKTRDEMGSLRAALTGMANEYGCCELSFEAFNLTVLPDVLQSTEEITKFTYTMIEIYETKDN